MYFKQKVFKGTAPKVATRLLLEDMAQAAHNVNLEAGNLRPLNINGQPTDLVGNNVQTYYKYEFGGTDYNLEFSDDVDVVPGAIADDAFDRLYWTGQTFPRMASSTEITTGSGAFPRGSFRLGIEAPAKTPVAGTPTGTDDGTQIKYSTAYVYTYVTPFGEEGPPSAASNVVTKVDGQTVLVTNLGAVPSKTDTSYGTRVKINATVTTASGSPTLTVTHDGSRTFTAGDAVALDGFAATGGIPADAINSTFNIATVPSGTTFTVTSNPSTNASSTATSASATLAFNFFGTKRIYRSNTGSNTTDFQFVAEISMSDNGYADSKNNDQLGEVIPSTFWIAPPDDDSGIYPNGQMKGLTAIGNGIFAGFSGKRLCFSEPFLPHAWPVAYRTTLEDEIVGISMAGSVLFIGTKGTNYIAAGTDPQAMSIQKLETAEPLIYKKSLVDMGGYCLYAGADGLIAVENGQVTNVTEELISGKLWQSYQPEAAGRHENKYIGTMSIGGTLSQCFSLEIGAGLNSLTIIDNVVSEFDATRRNWRAFYTDPNTNELFVVKGGQNVNGVDTTSTNCQVEAFDTRIPFWRGAGLTGANNTRRQTRYTTRPIILEKPSSMSFIKVVCDFYDAGGVKINIDARPHELLQNSEYANILDTSQLVSATIEAVNGKLQLSGSFRYFGTLGATGYVGDLFVPYNAHSMVPEGFNNTSGVDQLSMTAQTNPTPINIPEPIIRLPKGLFDTYHITIFSHNHVHEVCLAESIDELRAL